VVGADLDQVDLVEVVPRRSDGVAIDLELSTEHRACDPEVAVAVEPLGELVADVDLDGAQGQAPVEGGLEYTHQRATATPVAAVAATTTVATDRAAAAGRHRACAAGAGRVVCTLRLAASIETAFFRKVQNEAATRQGREHEQAGSA
jgi:hypothetical protein